MDIWKDITEYEGLYQVSNTGKIKNTLTGYILKGSLDGKGYLFVWLYKNKERKRFRIHRLVANAFIPNPENKPCIDHIDTNRINNNVLNLRWVTQKENLNNNITKERLKVSNKDNITKATAAIKKKILCVTTGKIFNSVREAADYYNCPYLPTNMCRIVSGKRKTYGRLSDGTKLEWRYIDE